MADNYAAGPMGSGVLKMSDDVAGVWADIVKLAFGALDTATLVSAANPFPVTIISGAGGTEYTEDAVAAADPAGGAMILVRRDTPSATEVSLDGDNVAAKGNSAGAQYVELLSGIAKIGGDAANGLDVDVTRLPALVAGSANIGDVDVLTVPAPLNVVGTGTEAAALRVTLATDSTGLVSVDDNLGSLTVDAPVATPVFVRLSDGAAAIATLPVSLATVPSHAVTNAGTFATQAAATIAVVSGTATLSNVASSATSVTLLASNAGRKGAIISNDSTAILYVKFGATASATSFTYELAAGDQLELMVIPLYTGIIDGIWASANGSARVTEMT